MVEKKQLPTVMGYMLRYVETFMKTADLIRNDVIGTPITFSSTVYVSQLFRRGKGWRYDPAKSGGGVIAAQATHLIDLLHWYFGEVASVSGHTRSWYSQKVEDFAHAHLTFSSGVTGWLDSTWSKRHHRLMQVTIDINGEHGSLLVTNDKLKLFLDAPRAGYRKGWTTWYLPDLFEGVEIDLGGPEYTRQDKELTTAIENGRMPENDVRSGFKVQQIVDAVYASAAEKGAPMCPADC